MYLCLAVVGLHCCRGFSLAAASGGYSLFAVLRLLIAVAFLGEHRLQGTWAAVVSAPRLQSTGSGVVGHRLKVTPSIGTFPDQGSNPSPALAVRCFTTLSHQRSPLHTCFLKHGLHCPSILKPPTVFKPLLGSLDFVFITPLKLVIRKSPVTSQVSDPDLLISDVRSN